VCDDGDGNLAQGEKWSRTRDLCMHLAVSGYSQLMDRREEEEEEVTFIGCRPAGALERCLACVHACVS
jgi:hypothetical protein